MDPLIEQVGKEIDTLNKSQCLYVLKNIWNERGLREMIGYFTIGSYDTKLDADEKVMMKGYLKVIKEAKKLV